MRRARAIALGALLALPGCAVGPDFTPPGAPAGKDYALPTLAATAAAGDVQAGAAQRFLREMDIPGQWWQLFHSEPLDRLIEQALKANPNLQAAQAALRIAEENAAAQRGAYYPQLSGNFSSTREKTATGSVSPASATGNPYLTLHTAQVSVSYVPDVFGLNRRTAESLEAETEAQRFQLEATYLALTSNLVAAAVQEASLRGQIAATEDIIRIETDLLGLFRRQFALGQIAEADVVAQEAALAQAEASLPPLRKQLAIERDLLTALAGRYPNEEPTQTFELASLHLPEELPASLPAKLVEQRPDLRQAEANLHSATALVGVAIANRLPNLTLSGDIGTSATALGRFLTPGTGFWDLTASLTQPIFQGGSLLHKERAARAALDQAAAQYRAALITAFQNVADTLRALQIDGDALKAAVRAERAAAESLAIARRQLELGAVSYLALLTAQQAYQTARIALVQAQANRFADTAALFQALGGGWWNRNDVTAGESAAQRETR
jgi:NodT family efflux transporter outer membrane factor (OMF) lipoprotein